MFHEHFTGGSDPVIGTGARVGTSWNKEEKEYSVNGGEGY